MKYLRKNFESNFNEEEIEEFSQELMDIGFEFTFKERVTLRNPAKPNKKCMSLIFTKQINFRPYYTEPELSDIEEIINKNDEIKDIIEEIIDPCNELISRLGEKYNLVYFENNAFGDNWRIWIDITNK